LTAFVIPDPVSNKMILNDECGCM